eukprot:3207698-Alexandrium_andersonii.AAC.1
MLRGGIDVIGGASTHVGTPFTKPVTLGGWAAVAWNSWHIEKGVRTRPLLQGCERLQHRGTGEESGIFILQGPQSAIRNPPKA